jgi:hypothetical protein
MTAITFNTSRATIAVKLRELAWTLRDAVDAFAAYRIRRAVPESEPRRVAHEIARYRGLMQTQANPRS